MVGIVVFLSIKRVFTPPKVSMPNDKGVTSKSRTSFTSPLMMAAWMAAPKATHSIGSTPRSIFFAYIVFHEFLDYGHPGGAADHNNAVNIFSGQLSVRERLFHRMTAAVNNRADEVF